MTKILVVHNPTADDMRRALIANEQHFQQIAAAHPHFIEDAVEPHMPWYTPPQQVNVAQAKDEPAHSDPYYRRFERKRKGWR